MDALINALKTHPIIYITRDIDRAIGLPLDTAGYYIISNATPVAKETAQGRTNIVLIDEGRPLDTWELLEHEKTVNFIYGLRLLVFKNSKKIEQICQTHGWRLLNPPAELANKIEEKITQLSFLSELRDLFPTYTINKLSAINYQLSAIVQFNHSHTGEGTILIDSPEQLNALKQKFPKREVRVTRYIEGPIFTNNNIVHKDGVLVGNISYQITGLKPYTDNPFATVGNNWGVVKKLLTEKQMEAYKAIANRVGDALKTKGWKGLFGIDVILDQARGKLYLLEINARQPQSATFESQLQSRLQTDLQNITPQSEIQSPRFKLTTFEAHLASLLNLDLSSYELTNISDGMQIIDRRTNTWQRSEVSDLPLTSNLKSQSNTLSPQALQIISSYLRLPLATLVPCPYINNHRFGIRAGLRAQIGKGSPDEIVEEAKIMALKEKLDLTSLNSEQLTKFLIDHNIGIDCSALVFYTLDAECKARGKSGLKRHLKFPDAKTIIQKLRAKLRPIENINIQTLADDANSAPVELKNIRPGDLIIMQETGERHDRNHVLLVHEIGHFNTTTQQHNNTTNLKFKICNLQYIHSFAWRTDGKYGHGARQGKIEITDISKPLTEQRWIEQGKEGSGNETLAHAKLAHTLIVRRLNLIA